MFFYMTPSAVVERRRRDPELIGDFVARPALLYAFQAAPFQPIHWMQ